MRVLYLHQYFNTPDMNGGTRSYEFARRLVRDGHQVFLVTADSSNSLDTRFKLNIIDGIHVCWINVPYNNKMNFFRRLRSFLLFSYYSTKYSMSLRFDVIFATSTPLTIAIPAIICSKFKNVPMIFEVRDLWPELPIAIGALKNRFAIKLAKFLEYIAYRSSRAVITLSPSMALGVISSGYDSALVHVIPNSCDIDKFNSIVPRDDIFSRVFNFSRNSDHKIILYAGTFGKINGILYLVKLAEQMLKINSNVIFLLLGDGAEYEMICSAAKYNGTLNKNIFISPGVSKNLAFECFSASDIVAGLFLDIPAMRSNSSNKFFDGLAAGKPIMINYAGWQADIITVNKCGIVLHGVSFPEAAQRLNSLFADNETLNKMSINSRKVAIDNFEREYLYGKFLKVLMDAAK